MLDTVVTAETPEGILLELRPAGLTGRCYAFVVDWLIRIAVLYAVQMAAVFAGGIGIALWLILFFALEWFYPVAFELTPSGATPGKRVFGLRVLMDNGLPVTAAASVTRNLLRFADFFPFGYGFAIVSILLRRDCKRLGDLAAGTIVVYATRAGSPAPLDRLNNIAPVVPTLRLAPADQAAVIALAARAPRLTPERLDELAALAAVVSGDGGRRGPAVTRRVLGVSQWLMGRR